MSEAAPGIGGADDPNNELVLVYDWANESNNFLSPGWLRNGSDNLFASILGLPDNIAGLDANETPAFATQKVTERKLHFIAHSRGAIMHQEVIHRFGAFFSDLEIDHSTMLDPRPATVRGTGSRNPGRDPGRATYTNVRHAENYWRRDNFIDGDFDPPP